MSSTKGLFKLGGVGFVLSGLLFLLRAILDLTAGEPPLDSVEIPSWVATHRLIISLDSEILFFAAVALIPAAIALYSYLVDVDRPKAAFGCGMLAVVVPVIMGSLVVHGRLVYPTFGIRAATPDFAALVLGVFYGGMHAVYLLMAGATLLLSLALKRAALGKPVAYLGFITAPLDIAAGYPDGIGPTRMLMTQVFFAAWFVAVGLLLYRMRARVTI
ncbi:MAG TPA: hypothetical protein VJ816_10230 [Gemmatimonadales bacterium]|nr:hypothetical protein [Gemmatimonadales bacterium]